MTTPDLPQWRRYEGSIQTQDRTTEAKTVMGPYLEQAERAERKEQLSNAQGVEGRGVAQRPSPRTEIEKSNEDGPFLREKFSLESSSILSPLI